MGQKKIIEETLNGIRKFLNHDNIYDGRPVNLPEDIEQILCQSAIIIKQYVDFRIEWQERFGFLATRNTPDSFESIDEVANLLSKDKQNKNHQQIRECFQ